MKLIDPELLNSAELQPLQQLAAVRMAIPICESEDVQSMIRSFSKINRHSAKGFSDDQWKQLCNIVRNKLDRISVPKLMVKIILEKMWPISFEILKWILCHDADMGIDSSSKFYWTPLLTINYKKTAEMLIKKETIDIKNRFKLACFYCWEVEIRSLWEMMILPEKRCFFVRGNLKKSDLNPIVLYWAYYIQEVQIDYWQSKTFDNLQLFKYAVVNGYLYATKFLLGKFEKRKRNRMISNSFKVNLFTFFYDRQPTAKSSQFVTAYFLISEANFGLRDSRGHLTVNLIFRCFLEWPLQKHFMDVFDRFRCYTKDIDFGSLLEAILEKDLGGFKDYDYKNLFMEFWRQSPEESKRYVNTVTKFGKDLLFRFVKKHFGFVLDQNSLALKAKFRAAILDIPERVSYFEQENVEFFKFLFQECVVTKASISSISNEAARNFPDEDAMNSPDEDAMYSPDEDAMYFSDEEFHSSNMFLEELMYLIDIIVGDE